MERTPIFEAIKKYWEINPLPFHMPGHKMGAGLNIEFAENMAKCDLTEIPGLDNLHFPEEAVKDAQELASKAFGADHTFFLVNGSTVGLHAAVMSVLDPGDSIIVPRDCHRSVIGAIMLARANPIYMKPGISRSFGIPLPVSMENVLQAVEKNPGAKGVLLTRPTYYGICCGLSEAADYLHSRGKVLLVDEAHGAHLGFSQKLPVSAMQSGADISVQSGHKTLTALTQGAYLNIRGGRIDLERLKFNLRLLSTTSPSYLVMTSLDLARSLFENYGKSLLDGLSDNLDEFGGRISRYIGLKLLESKDVLPCETDKTRLVIDTAAIGIRGFEAEGILRRDFGVQVEMSDPRNIVLISTIADKKKDLDRLYDALNQFENKFRRSPLNDDIIYEYTFEQEQAVKLDRIPYIQGRKISFGLAAGKISKTLITPYPPGIPVVCPGERISSEAVAYISSLMKAGGKVNGIEDGMIEVVA